MSYIEQVQGMIRNRCFRNSFNPHAARFWGVENFCMEERMEEYRADGDEESEGETVRERESERNEDRSESTNVR